MFGKVIVDIASSNVDKIFDYRLDEPLPIGTRVAVPFGNRKMEGYIIDIAQESELDESKIKSVIGALDPFPVITPEQLKIAEFMRKRFHIGYADCIRLFLPAELRSGKVGEVIIEVVSVENETELKEFQLTLRKTATKQNTFTNKNSASWSICSNITVYGSFPKIKYTL